MSTEFKAVVVLVLALVAASSLARPAPQPPEWAVMYTDGLKAWRDIIYYWIDRQRPDGTFGFGWGDDCEMTVGWPGVMMTADDRGIEESLLRPADNNWFNPAIQNGYQ